MIIDLQYMPYYYELRDGNDHPYPLAHARAVSHYWANALGIPLNATRVKSIHMGSSHLFATSYTEDLQGHTPPSLTYLESQAVSVKLTTALLEVLEMLPTEEAQQAYIETVAKEQNDVHIS